MQKFRRGRICRRQRGRREQCFDERVFPLRYDFRRQIRPRQRPEVTSALLAGMFLAIASNQQKRENKSNTTNLPTRWLLVGPPGFARLASIFVHDDPQFSITVRPRNDPRHLKYVMAHRLRTVVVPEFLSNRIARSDLVGNPTRLYPNRIDN